MKTKINHTIKIMLMLITVSIFSLACAQQKSEETASTTVKVQKPSMSIHEAIIGGNFEVFERHIEARTDINLIEPMGGSTPLMTAITFDKPKMVKALIEADADLSITNKDGGTALHNAAFFGKVEMVQLLLDAGADKTIKNNYGATPREIVMSDWEQMKPIYNMLTLQLQPMGFTLDLNEVEKARPVIAMMLE